MQKNRAGKFIKVQKSDASYICFVPNKLPLDDPIKYDEEMIWLLSEANRVIGRLDEITDTLLGPDFFVYMYARNEATLSSQVEGTRATFSDLIKKEAGIEDKEIPDDVKEIENYINAINYGFERLNTLPLSLRLIKEIHKVLLEDVRGQHKMPGEFRNSQNWIGGTSINNASYIPPSTEYMNNLLDNFEKFLHTEDKIPILIRTALIHAQFEMIHPFLDGNGRIGRLLIAFYLEHENVLHKPTLYLSKYFKKYRQQYYDSLSGIHNKGDYETWIKFFLEGVIYTAKEGVETARKIEKLKDEDMLKLNLLGRSSKNATIIFKQLFKKPTITIEETANILGIKFPNAKKLIDKLIDNGILELLGERKRNRVFIYRKYMDIFKEDL